MKHRNDHIQGNATPTVILSNETSNLKAIGWIQKWNLDDDPVYRYILLDEDNSISYDCILVELVLLNIINNNNNWEKATIQQQTFTTLGQNGLHYILLNIEIIEGLQQSSSELWFKNFSIYVCVIFV